MKVIDCDWIKRNGNGQSTCHLCNKLTWDSWCYDFELKILDKELFNTVLCGDCISKIKKEMECKMTSNVEIIEEDKDIEKLDIKKIYVCDEYQYIHINFKNTWNKINELIDEVNRLKNKEK